MAVGHGAKHTADADRGGHHGAGCRVRYHGSPNCNKSGRALKRLVETNIISGHYDVARKYITILEKTTFYSGWARKMRQLVDHPEQIVNYPFLHSAQKEYENATDIFFI